MRPGHSSCTKSQQVIPDQLWCLFTEKPGTDHTHPSLYLLGIAIQQEDLADLVQRYLFCWEWPDDPTPSNMLPLESCPSIRHCIFQIHTYPSATATFHAPSNPSGSGGMFHEVIQATKYWRRRETPGPQYDCVYIVEHSVLQIARVHSFFSFKYKGNTHWCVLVHWYRLWRDEPDHNNSMYIMMLEYAHNYWCMFVVNV